MSDHIESAAKNDAFWRIAEGLGALALVAGLIKWPDTGSAIIQFVAVSLIEVAPIVIPGILLAAWVVASGADAHIARIFDGRVTRRWCAFGSCDGLLAILTRYRSSHARNYRSHTGD